MYQAIILGCILLVTLNILKRSRDPKVNLPQLVPYKIPIIGHTISYMFNCEEFVKQCRKEYGDIFNLYVWGRVITFVGKEHMQEVLTKEDIFDYIEAFDRVFPTSIIFKTLGKSSDPVKEMKDYILSKLGSYSEHMQKCLYSVTQKYIGDCDEPKTICNLYKLMSKIISAQFASIYVGEEVAQFDDTINTFANFGSDVATLFALPPFLDFIYPYLQSRLIRVPLSLGLYNPSAKHRSVLINHIANQVEKRLQEKQTYGDLWKRPNDLLQELMELEQERLDNNDNDNDNNINYEIIADKIGFFIFASVHSTSRACAMAVMNLASRPECMQELYEEQLEIHKQADENGVLPFEALNEMKKLDSFVRETLRLSGSVTFLPHVVLEDYTFSNGLQVPKDHAVELYFDDALKDESSQGPNPKSFEPFRHLNKDASASKISKNYVIFGGGKHACPGRHFAVTGIKYFMHNIILKYNFRTESGKIEENRRLGPIAIANDSGVIFEKRIK